MRWNNYKQMLEQVVRGIVRIQVTKTLVLKNMGSRKRTKKERGERGREREREA